MPARRFISGTKRWKSPGHILVTGYVVEMVLTVGFTEPLGSVKACQGFREDEVMFKGILHFDREYFGKKKVRSFRKSAHCCRFE